jgi:hypothetical protein
MGVILIRCPRTGLDASTGIQTDPASFEAMPEVRSTMTCPRCGAVHVWSKKWTVLSFDDDINGLDQGQASEIPALLQAS